MVIFPEITVTPDTPTIRFHQPQDQVDLSTELPRILGTQGWGCGTYFNVQFLNHERTRLLACARFVVSEEDESVQTNNANPHQPVTRTVYTRKAEQIEDWHVPLGTGPSLGEDMSVTEKRRGRPPKQAQA